MARRSYSDEERQAALALYETDGPRAVEAQLGVPIATVSDWAKANGIRTRSLETKSAATQASAMRWEQRRLELAHEMGEVAELALDLARAKIAEEKPSSAKDSATTMAILVDKAQLLTGAATTRTEHVKASVVDEEIRKLTEELELSGAA